MQWGEKFRPKYAQLVCYVHNLIGNSVPWFACSATFNPKMLEMAKKSLGFNNANMHFKQIFIAYKKFVFCLGQILKDTVTKYTLLCFFFNKAVNPPTIETYINFTIF